MEVLRHLRPELLRVLDAPAVEVFVRIEALRAHVGGDVRVLAQLLGRLEEPLFLQDAIRRIELQIPCFPPCRHGLVRTITGIW